MKIVSMPRLSFCLLPLRGHSSICSCCASDKQQWRRGVVFPSSTSHLHRTWPPLSLHHHRHKNKKGYDTENNGTDDSRNNISRRLFDPEQINALEIRLDATLLAIYVLCRFLVYDINTGIKQIPGWGLHDVVMILQTFSSAIVLSGLWTLVGVLITGIFRYDNDDNDSEAPIWRGVPVTTIISAPVWIFTEISLGWPTAGTLWQEITGGNSEVGAGMFTLSNQESLLYLFTLIITSSLGVGCFMALGRYIRNYIA